MSSPEKEQPNAYPLPIVAEDTVETALHDLDEAGHDEYLLRAFQDLLNQNPNLANAVLGFIEGAAETEQEEFIAQKAVALLHEILRKQAAAAQLNRHLE